MRQSVSQTGGPVPRTHRTPPSGRRPLQSPVGGQRGPSGRPVAHRDELAPLSSARWPGGESVLCRWCPPFPYALFS
eukprot:6024244-Pyramimonas_sp.AAC.1